MNTIKCAVFGLNNNGEPDIFFCKITCKQEEYDNGNHYQRAKELAQKEGYKAFLACDENDPAGAVMHLCQWKSIPTHS